MYLKGLFHRIHPLGKIALLIICFVVCLSITMFLGIWIYLAIKGGPVDLTSFNQLSLDNPGDLRQLRITQILSHLGGFILPSLIFAFIAGHTMHHYLKTNRIPLFTSLTLALIIILAMAPAINFLMEINNKLSLPESLKSMESWMRLKEDQAEVLTKAMLGVTSIQGLLFNIFMIAIIPAIGEEFLFRGIILQIFKEWTKNIHAAVWISAILFSAFHLQFYGFLPRMVLGVLFGYMLILSHNIWIPVFAHFINNSAAVISFYLFHNKHTSDNLDHLGQGVYAPWLALGSLLFTFTLLVLMNRVEKSRQNPFHLT